MLLGSLLVALGFYGSNASADTPAIDPELVKRIAEQVVQQLRQTGALDDVVDQGISRFIERQRQQQAEQRAAAQAQAGERAKQVRRVSKDRDHVYGNPDAVISLIEYSDFECPFCKRFHATPKRLVEAYDGKVNWVYRHFPLAFHNPLAQKQAEASECAAELGGNEGFWRYTDTIYELTRSNGQGMLLSDLVPIAGRLGFEQEAFAKCLDSGRHTRRVLEDAREGQNAGISGTPGNILLHHASGKVRVVSGAVPVEKLAEAVDELLAEANGG